MVRVLLVGLAGGLGSIARYLVVGAAERALGTSFPWGVLGVNVVGSLLMGLVAAIAVARADLSPLARLALTTGFLGGFTTYSAFNHDTLALFERRQYGLAFGYVAATLVACLAAGAVGAALGRR